MTGPIFLVLFLISVVAGVLLFIRCRTSTVLDRCMYALIPIAGFQCFAAIVNKLHDAPFIKWNEARIATSFGLRIGVPLYPAPGGIITSYVCGPMGGIVYLPATIAASPTMAMVIGCAVAVLVTCLPAFWLTMRGKNDEARIPMWMRLLVFFLFILLTQHLDALKYSVYNVHFDAPALGLGGLACCVMISSLQRTHLKYALVALLACLGIWSKQPLGPLALTLPLYVLLTRGWKEAAIFTGYFALIGIVVSAVMVLRFGPFSNLYFCMFELPAHVPWYDNKMGVLLGILERASIPLAVVLFVWMFQANADKPARGIRQFILEQDASLFLLAGFINMSTSFLGVVKIGGDVNNYSFAIYFLTLGALLSLKRALVAGSGDIVAPIQTLVVAALLMGSAVEVSRNYEFIKDQPELFKNNAQLAFEYERAHPGDAYFPWNPLAHVMAEGHYYHFDWGLYDRWLAKMPLTDEEFRKGIPPAFNYVIYPEPRPLDPTPAMFYLKEYSVESASQKFPGWQIFHRPVAAPQK